MIMGKKKNSVIIGAIWGTITGILYAFEAIIFGHMGVLFKHMSIVWKIILLPAYLADLITFFCKIF